ncbi:hypothetical protein [Streptomyces sp. NPDC055607]
MSLRTAWWKATARSSIASGVRKSGGADLGVHGLNAAGNVGAGVTDEDGDPGGEGGGAQIEFGQEAFGEVEFVVGERGVGEGEGQGKPGLSSGAFTDDATPFGLGVGRFVRGSRAVRIAVEPPEIAFDTVMTPGSTESGDDRVGGREVIGESGKVRQAWVGRQGQAATAVDDDVLHAAARFDGGAEIALALGEVVDGHLLQLAGQPGCGEGGEPVDDDGAVLVLAADEHAEEFDQAPRPMS